MPVWQIGLDEEDIVEVERSPFFLERSTAFTRSQKKMSDCDELSFKVYSKLCASTSPDHSAVQEDCSWITGRCSDNGFRFLILHYYLSPSFIQNTLLEEAVNGTTSLGGPRIDVIRMLLQNGAQITQGAVDVVERLLKGQYYDEFFVTRRMLSLLKQSGSIVPEVCALSEISHPPSHIFDVSDPTSRKQWLQYKHKRYNWLVRQLISDGRMHESAVRFIKKI